MIKYFVMDVDGTLTDGKIYMGTDGEFVKAFDIKDGCGIHDLLIPSGIVPVIITGRTSQIVRNRCRELGITALYQGISNKKEKLEEILRENDDSCLNVAYIGDDINDLECMQEVLLNGGVVGCPRDAVEEVKNIASYVSNKDGGAGAVRDFIEWVLKK